MTRYLASTASRSLNSLFLSNSHAGSRLTHQAFERFHYHLRPSPRLSFIEAKNAIRSGVSRSFTASRMHARVEGSVDSPAAAIAGGLTKRNGITRLYLQVLNKHPILTKSVTAGTICFFADLTSQGITKIKSDEAEMIQWDVGRTLRMVAAGLFLSGPTLHLWFNFISKILPKRDLVSTLKKITLGQTVYGPTFTVIFFSLNAFVQGESTDEVKARLRRDFFPTIKSGLMYWPLCDFLTYRYVPVHLQPLASNSFSYVWTIYLTYMAGLKKVDPTPSDCL